MIRILKIDVEICGYKITHRSYKQMQYFDFQSNWEQFYNILHSPEIVALLKDHGLSHPLYKCNADDGSDGYNGAVMELANEDPERLREYKVLCKKYGNPEISRKAAEKENELFHKYIDKHEAQYLKKYYQPKMMITNVPVGRCHDIAPALLLIARTLYPKKEWTLFRGQGHSTVLCKDDNIVFDLIYYFLKEKLVSGDIPTEITNMNQIFLNYTAPTRNKF